MDDESRAGADLEDEREVFGEDSWPGHDITSKNGSPVVSPDSDQSSSCCSFDPPPRVRESSRSAAEQKRVAAVVEKLSCKRGRHT